MLHSSNIRMTAVMLPQMWLSKICFNFCICFISPVKNGSVTFTLSENIIIMHDTLSPLVLILQASVYLMFRLTLVSFSSPQSSTIYSLVDFLGKAHANNTLWILTCWSLLCPLYLKISFVGCKILGTFFFSLILNTKVEQHKVGGLTLHTVENSGITYIWYSISTVPSYPQFHTCRFKEPRMV